MSQNLKTALKYWFFLVMGIVLVSMQAYKYVTNTLAFNTNEAIILFVGLMFIIRPTALPDLMLKIFNKK